MWLWEVVDYTSCVQMFIQIENIDDEYYEVLQLNW